jgi:serine/threonine-protein kinase HipA
MNRAGKWWLSPAFDLTWSYNPTGRWTSAHQMSIAGKRDDFTLGDFLEVGKLLSMKPRQIENMLEEISEAVAAWPELAGDAGVEMSVIKRIAETHRLEIGQQR